MNKHWKIAFCGLGSIGSRHLRNISDIFAQRGDSFSVDWIRSGDKELPDVLKTCINRVFTYEDEIDSDYDIIFVTNPTNKHYETIDKYQWYTKTMFIEKPLFDNDTVQLKNINRNCLFYVACPVRYKKVIQYLKENVNLDKVYSSISICSSYLPEWRKGTDYRKGYSAIKKMGGGVSLDLIHEIDYLIYLFGEPKEIYNIREHVSNLEIDSDDVSLYITRFNRVVSQVYLDYFGRKDIRTFTLICEDDTINVDLLKNTVSFLKEGKIVSFEETRDDFQKAELLYFLDVIEGKADNTNDLNRAFDTLKNTFGRI